MQSKNKILDEFGAYLILYKKLSVATYNAYKHDVQNFNNYLRDSEIDFESLNEHIIKQYFDFLQTKKTSSSAAARSAGALKLFTAFLHEKYNYPDYSYAIKVDKKFPFICNDKEIKLVISNFESKYYSMSKAEILYQDLRNYIMFYFLSVIRININDLISMRVSYINFNDKSLQMPRKNTTKISLKPKSVNLPFNFFGILKDYVNLIPYDTIFLFPIKLGETVNPISKQAAWATMRLFITKSKQKLELNTEKHIVDQEFQDTYKKLHPRS